MNVELSGHYGYKRLLLTLSPMVGMMVICSIYCIVDGFFVSNFIGSKAFASMNIIWPGISVIAAVGLMFGSGGSALVSKTLGEGNPEKARKIFSMITAMCVVVGIVGAVFGMIFIEEICVVLGADAELLADAKIYGMIVIPALPFFMVQLAFQSFYMAAEKPQLGTAMSIISGVMNLVLDYVFIVMFGWGIAGAAAATSAGLFAGGVFPLIHFLRKKGTLYFVRFPIDLKSAGKTCSNGLSEFVGNIAFNLVSICYNIQLMRYIGTPGVAAYGIIMYVAFIFGAVFIGFNSGVAQIIAYNYGAGNHEELSSLLRKSFVLIAICGLGMTAISELFAPLISDCFVSYDTSLSELSTTAMRIYMLSFLLCGVNMFTSAWFTALNNGMVSAVVAFTRTIVFEMACIFVLPLLFGTTGIWISVLVAELMAFIMSITLILAYRKRYSYSFATPCKGLK